MKTVSQIGVITKKWFKSAKGIEGGINEQISFNNFIYIVGCFCDFECNRNAVTLWR